MGAFLQSRKRITPEMLAERVIVIALMLPIGLAAIWMGGWYFAAVVLFFVGIAAWEYVQLFRLGGVEPMGILVVGGTGMLIIGRTANGFESGLWILSLLVLISLTYHLLAYERGRNQAGTDFGVTLGGRLYLGWIGGYLISIRSLPEGQWWVLLGLSSVWVADSAAYAFGKQFGRHKLSPRLSPGKTWEGYLGGVITSTLWTAGLAFVLRFFFTLGPVITPLRGGLLGLTLSSVSVLGDLGESMFKRQVGMKDSGKLLPGHGGAFDRIDSWLWAGVIGYYIVQWVLFEPR